MTSDLADKIYVDFDADGSFDTAGDDISAWWKSTTPSTGLRSANDHCATVGQCTIVLNNASKIFSPDYTSGTYYGKLLPKLPVKVETTDGVMTWAKFRGYVEDWKPDSGHIHGSRECVLTAVDAMGALQGANISLPLQVDETAATVLQKVCNIAYGAATATNSLTFWDKVTDGTTVTVGDRVYTFKDTLTGASNEVQITSAAYQPYVRTALNLARAINKDTGEGTDYGTGTARHPYVTASISSQTVLGHPSADVSAYVALRDAASNYEALSLLIAGFLPSPTGADEITFDSIGLFLKKTGAPAGTLTLRLEGSGGQYAPSGTLIDANATGTLAETLVSGAGAYAYFDIGGTITLYPYARYHVVLTTNSASSGVNYISWGYKTSGPFSFCAKQAGAWALQSANDAMIYIPCVVSLSANAPGTWGNSLGLSTTAAASVISVNAASFSGGTDAPSSLVSFDTGQIFPLAGDTWSDDRTNGLDAAKDIADSEYGLLYVNAAGIITFKDYQWIFEQLPTAASLTLTNHPDSIRPRVALSDIHNEIIVEYIPRRQSAAGVVIATANGQIKVPARGSATIKLTNVEAGTGQVVGTYDLIAPVAVTDYKVWNLPTASNQDQNAPKGVDVTSRNKIRPSLAIKGGQIEATFTSTAVRDLYVHPFQVRGTALIAYDRQQVIKRDTTSIAAYGRKGRTIKLPFPSDQRFAESIAEYELARNKTPRTVVESVSFRGTRTVGGTNLHSLDIGAIVALTDTQTGLNGVRYMIIGKKSDMDVEGNNSVTWIVRRMDDPQTWVLGDASYSQLGSTTVLAL